MTDESPIIQKLKAQQAEIQKKLTTAKKAEAKKKDALQAQKNQLTGHAISKEIADNPAFKSTIQTIIEKHTTNARDRLLLGLSPIQKQKKTANAVQMSSQAHK